MKPSSIRAPLLRAIGVAMAIALSSHLTPCQHEGTAVAPGVLVAYEKVWKDPKGQVLRRDVVSVLASRPTTALLAWSDGPTVRQDEIDIGFVIGAVTAIRKGYLLICGAHDGVAQLAGVDITGATARKCYHSISETSSGYSDIGYNEVEDVIYALDATTRQLTGLKCVIAGGLWRLDTMSQVRLSDDMGIPTRISCYPMLDRGCYVETGKPGFHGYLRDSHWWSGVAGQSVIKVSYWDRFAGPATSWQVADSDTSICAMAFGGKSPGKMELRDAGDGRLIGSWEYEEANALCVKDLAALGAVAGHWYFVAGSPLDESRPFGPLWRSGGVFSTLGVALGRGATMRGRSAFVGCSSFQCSVPMRELAGAAQGGLRALLLLAVGNKNPDCRDVGGRSVLVPGTVVDIGRIKGSEAELWGQVGIPDRRELLGKQLWMQFVVIGEHEPLAVAASDIFGADIVEGSREARSQDIEDPRRASGKVCDGESQEIAARKWLDVILRSCR